jgi:peptidoglycan/xylan/chitin deacetylase (PgdA/CDA1 family)
MGNYPNGRSVCHEPGRMGFFLKIVYNNATMTERNFIITVLFIFSAFAGGFFGYNRSNLFPLKFPRNEQKMKVKPIEIRQPVKVPIVIYHSVRPYTKGESAEQDRYDITPELFAKQLQYLKNNKYTTISFEMLANYFDRGETLPTKPVILSFDDSWKNQYIYAFPVLKTEKMTGTFFVFTNSLNRKNHLRWDDVREMQKEGMEIGSHTKFHPYLDNIKDPAILEKEIAGSKSILEESLGTTTIAFAYPFGEHGTTTRNEVKKAGYRIARAIRGGNMQAIEDRYTLRGFIVSDNFEEFVRNITK